MLALLGHPLSLSALLLTPLQQASEASEIRSSQDLKLRLQLLLFHAWECACCVQSFQTSQSPSSRKASLNLSWASPNLWCSHCSLHSYVLACILLHFRIFFCPIFNFFFNFEIITDS